MKNALLISCKVFFFCLAFPLYFHAQTNTTTAGSDYYFYPVEGNNHWLKVKDGIQLSASELARSHKAQLGLGVHDELVNYQIQEDNLGILHYRFQQYHKGIKVDGAILMMHEKEGKVFLINGNWVPSMDADITVYLNETDALSAALDQFPAEKYMWDSPEAERLLKRVKRDPDATFYPQPEQVLIDPGLNQLTDCYQMAYRMEIHTLKPLETRKQVYVDAADGKILLELEMMHTQDSIGLAETKYSGSREIVTDQIAPDSFRLVETGRGGGIETYNMRTLTDYDFAVDFTDGDNFWNNVNEQQDEAATDAHWGAEMTYDYFNQKLNFSGLDGEHMPLINFVHYSENYVNAFWNGSWATFGDGNGNSFLALTSVDIVAHEFTHGVIEFSANLIYRNESGALNESFCDIFGSAVEIWASPEQGDWFIGEDFDLVNNGFRDMQDPKEDGDPDTYKGENWFAGEGDNGGVHTNSGVQNYWFYLLTEGGTGINDKGDEYTVDGLGLDTAAQIAFRNLQYYLSRRSEYEDARLGAIQAAEDIYGPCSEAVQQTMKAWYAVGIGREKTDFDVRLLDILAPGPIECGLSGDDFITIQLRYYGCNADLQAGDQIPLAYQVNDEPVFQDTLTLTNTLTAGDTLNFTFAQASEELTTRGLHRLKVWAAFEPDIVDENNTFEMIVDNVPAQNIDIGIVSLNRPVSGCFLSEGLVEIEFGFFGCENLPAGQTLDLSYSVNGGPVQNETIGTPPLQRGETFRHTMSPTVDLSALGRTYITAWIGYGPDYLKDNDTLYNVTVTNPLLIFNETVIDFEGDDALLDSVFWLTEQEASVQIKEEAARDGNYGLQMTGGDVLKAFENGEIVPPDMDTVWDVNQQFNSRFCFCLDLNNQMAAEMKFDRRQTYSSLYSEEFNVNLQYASPLRVLVNEVQLGPTFRPTNFNLPLWYSRSYDLEEFLGQQVEVCFEARALLNPAYDPVGVGDNTFIDNIVISGLTVATTEPIQEVLDFKVFPNPGRGVFTLDFQAEDRLDLLINILDVQGKQLASFKETTMIGKNIIPLDLNTLVPGMYIVQLLDGERQLVQKLIVE